MCELLYLIYSKYAVTCIMRLSCCLAGQVPAHKLSGSAGQHVCPVPRSAPLRLTEDSQVGRGSSLGGKKA